MQHISVCVCEGSHARACERAGQRSSANSLSPHWIEWLVGPPVFASSAGVTGAGHHAQPLMWVLGLELWSSRLHMSTFPTELSPQPLDPGSFLKYMRSLCGSQEKRRDAVCFLK